MASVHIDKIRDWIASQGSGDDGFFEIVFASQKFKPSSVDDEFANRAITVDSPQGIITLQFDEHGWLKSLDIS